MGGGQSPVTRGDHGLLVSQAEVAPRAHKTGFLQARVSTNILNWASFEETDLYLLFIIKHQHVHIS